MILLIYTTHPDKECAQHIAGLLLDRHLIACANIYPIHSMYRWENKIVSEEEYVALFKTKASQLEEVKKLIQNHHPYDVPCILHFPADGNAAYLDWIETSIDDVNKDL